MCKKQQQKQSTRKIFFTQPFPACVPMKAVALAAIHILSDFHGCSRMKLTYPETTLPPIKKHEGILYTTTQLKFSIAPEMETSQKGK